MNIFDKNILYITKKAIIVNWLLDRDNDVIASENFISPPFNIDSSKFTPDNVIFTDNPIIVIIIKPFIIYVKYSW